MRPSGMAKVGVAAATGAASAYLFDGTSGRARRARLRSQARSKFQHEARAVSREARRRRGRVSGLVHQVMHRQPTLPENDRVLVDKVRSEVLGRRPLVAHHVSVDAADGLVTLRGELDDAAAVVELETAVRKVTGVSGVANLLHQPGEPAPNKAGALAVGSST